MSAALAETKCNLCLVAAVCWYLLELFDGVVRRRGKGRLFYLANSNWLIPTYLQNGSKNIIKFLSPYFLCSTLSVRLSPTYRLSSILLVIVLTVKMTVQILQVSVQDAHRIAQ